MTPEEAVIKAAATTSYYGSTPIGEDNDSDDGDFSSESDDFSDDSDEDSEDDDVEERMSKPVERYRMQCKQQRSMGNLLWCLCSSRRLSVQATMEKHVVICTTPRGKSSMKQPRHHDAVATYLLGMRNIQWDLDRR
ncbi:uncharacterized protein PITG_15343 [Phytophthora infestans T30-4]|uniref:Uncharacterized protein n=1 Tax=Phytophthora infestans (strain T30-4) TaxID=403677 RepID=D0NQH1_PHYIT|nr:uncharacterized protein PITG_15343 [Phytophthora infestans T30-4]EEY62903.1 conserved hypothetical protein [Phytophthora infestans T30-4]|eukprot:XP_002898778.1 conserved hypothetical protein [Phytophthora infestans T30-4]